MDRIFQRRLTAVVLLIFGLVGNTAGNGTFDVSQNDDLISVSANNASLMAVISRLAETTGVAITHTDGRDVMITVDLVDATLEQIIDKLSKNSMIVRKTIDGKEVIAEVVVMLDDGGSSASDTASLPTGEPAEGVVVGAEPPPTDPTLEAQDGVMPTEPQVADDGTQVIEGTAPQQGSN